MSQAQPPTTHPASGSRTRSKQRVTLKDVARHAGLSRTTVSDVLNRGDAAAGLYADETRRRVEASVSVLGYRVNNTAQKLARGRSGLIGLVLLRDFSNPYFARFADAVGREVRSHGMRLHLAIRSVDADASEAERAQHDAELIEQMSDDGVEGLLLGPVYEELDLSQHEALVSGLLPTVLFGGQRRADLDAVTEDGNAGRRLAIEHLAELGHRRIGFLCAPPNRSDPTRVDHVFSLRLLEELGLFAGPQWVAWQPDSGDLDDYAAAAEAFAEAWATANPAERPTAVLTHNDAAAMAALGVFARRGIRVPDDLGVVGYDDLPESAHLVPALTSVNCKVPEQVAAAVSLLLARIAGSSGSPGGSGGSEIARTVPHLCVRASTNWHPGRGSTLTPSQGSAAP